MSVVGLVISTDRFEYCTFIDRTVWLRGASCLGWAPCVPSRELLFVALRERAKKTCPPRFAGGRFIFGR